MTQAAFENKTQGAPAETKVFSLRLRFGYDWGYDPRVTLTEQVRGCLSDDLTQCVQMHVAPSEGLRQSCLTGSEGGGISFGPCV